MEENRDKKNLRSKVSEINNKDIPSDTTATFTIPNVLSMIRIALIPAFMCFYFWCEEPFDTYYWLYLGVAALAAVTDLADGYIARHFHLISDLGKALDPLADKLSQFALLLCMVKQFPWMLFPLILLAVKELVTGSIGLFTYQKTGVIKGAVWHGKLTTVLLYSMMIAHLLYPSIPVLVSKIWMAVCCLWMLLSFVLYNTRYFRILKENKGKYEEEKTAPEGDKTPAESGEGNKDRR